MRKVLSNPVAIFAVSVITVLALCRMYPSGPYLINWATAAASLVELVLGETKLEAQSPQRLQIQAHAEWSPKEVGRWTNIVVVCDTANGNLIYSGAYEGGIAVVPNGCHKNPR